MQNFIIISLSILFGLIFSLRWKHLCLPSLQKLLLVVLMSLYRWKPSVTVMIAPHRPAYVPVLSVSRLIVKIQQMIAVQQVIVLFTSMNQH